jgi:thiol-disulfide isomerase/thioredoxin
MKYLSFILLLVIDLNILAQTSKSNNMGKQNLSIGDTLPSITLSKIYNQPGSSKKLNSFYNKLLIIDFWATWCEPCVAELPRLDSLHNKYRDQVTILPVTYEDYGAVRKLIQAHLLLKNSQLPFVIEDSVLNNFFKHTIVPHEIWINDKGIVMAITTQLEVTEANINSFLNETLAGLPLKKDEIDFEIGKPIVKHLWQDNSSLSDSTILDYSIVMKHRPGLPTFTSCWVSNLEESMRSTNSITYINGISIVNFGILNLFLTAFDLTFTHSPTGFLNPHRFILDVKDSLRYMEHTDFNNHDYTDSFQEKHTLIYEMKTSTPLLHLPFAKKMLEDLNRYFPLKGKIVKMQELCWIIIRKDMRADTLSSQFKTSEIYQTANTIGIKNKKLDVLLAQLNCFCNMEPLLNESGVDRPVDIELQFKQDYNVHPDITVIRRTFNKYGLDIVQEVRTVEKLYLTDKPENY